MHTLRSHSRSRRARALVLIATLALAVVTEPALALVRFSGAGLCACDHDGVEQSDTACATGLCHETSSEVTATDARPDEQQRPQNETCIEQLCPHCSSDEARMLSSLRGILVPAPRSEDFAHCGSAERAPHANDLPELPLEIFHIPIP